jgi:hypothetical protein
MAVAEDLLEGVRAFIGIERKCFVTEVDALSVARYARSIDDQNTLYFDAAAARACGYKGIIAPPNYLASVLDWSEGPVRTKPRAFPGLEFGSWVAASGWSVMNPSR